MNFIHHNVLVMMTRTQILLSTETHRRARVRSSELGVSLSEYIRRLLEKDLEAPTAEADTSVVFDLGASSGGSNIAADKDRMIGEAFADR